ncbi:AraC family transcriptional regulator, partial [Rhodococcus erythropolis]|nr:AraC family transcriptional regulator [Rhodococcus erythropolis]
MHDVAVLALPGVVPMDLAAPLEVFGRCRLPSGAPAYRTSVCALTEEVETGTFTMRVPHGLSRLAQTSTIIIPGTADLDVPIDP